ncbi:hypothetical protein ACLESD_16655 [Pyxidicoccus sp. 3LFB2]
MWVATVSVLACSRPARPPAEPAQDLGPSATARDSGPAAPVEPPLHVPPSGTFACTMIGCASQTVLVAVVDASLKVLRSSTLTWCLNGACHSLALKGLPEKLEPDGGPVDHEVQFPSYEKRADGQPILHARISPSPGAGFRLEARYAPWSDAELKDGDAHTVTVKTPQGRKLVDVSRTVKYSVSQPNGPNCPPTCLHGTLH